MTKLAHGPQHLGAHAGTLGIGGHALNVSRQLAGVRGRLSSKALLRHDVQLAAFAGMMGTDPWEVEAPLPESVLRHARDFLRVLPGTLPEPQVSRDGEGRLSFEWAGENARLLTVRVDPDGMLVYTGRLGPRRRVSGAEPLGAELPSLIRQAIQLVAC